MLPSEMFDADGSYPALNGGGDIRFSSDADGATQLACEVVSFVTDNDPASGSAEIWVKVPSLSSSTNTVIYVWYNKSGETQPAIDDAYGSEAVWVSGYKAVWHLQSNFVDSTSNDSDLTGSNSPTNESAKIGNGYDFNSADSESATMNDSAALSITSDISFEFWANADAYNGDGVVFGKHDYSTGARYGYYVYQNGNGYRVIIWNSSGARTEFKIPLTADDQGVWQRWSVSIDISVPSATIYKNGASTSFTSVATAVTTIADTVSKFGLGCQFNNGTPVTFFNGKLDEVRVYSGLLPSGWASTEYNNQNSPSTFATAGTPETPGGGGSTWTPKIIMY
jgi:hypothetical protein